MSLKFELEGNKIAPPQNWKELEVELNFDNDLARLTTSDFEFLGSSADFINQWIADGCNGGVGLLEPPVFEVKEICEAGIFNLLESTLKLDEAEFACDWVKTPIQELGNVDFLEQIADSFSLLYLIDELQPNEAGYISQGDISEIYYQTLDVPDVAQLMNLSLMAMSLTQDIISTISAGVDAIQAFAGNYPAYAEGLGQMILNSIQVTLLSIQSRILLQQITEALVPIPKKHRGLKVRTAFEKGCEYLGLKFSSSILTDPNFKNLCIIPKKTTQGVDIDEISTDDAVPESETFADFIRDLNEVFNAKVTIIGDTLHWERWDFFKEQSTFEIPHVKKEFSGTNANELNYNFVLSFQTDSADLQTFQQFDSGLYAHTVTPIVTNVNGITSSIQNAVDRKRLLMKGTDDRQFPFGMVGRKNTCGNQLENILIFINDIVENIAFLHGDIVRTAISNVASAFPMPDNVDLADYLPIPDPQDKFDLQFPCREGYMEIATDYLGIKRLCILDVNENLIHERNSFWLSGEYLWKNFHFINSPMPLPNNTEGNQWTTYKDLEIPFTCEDFATIRQQGHNYVNYKGKTAKLETLKWNPHNCIAKIDLRVQERFTCNLDYRDRTQPPSFIRDRYSELFDGFVTAGLFAGVDDFGETFNQLTGLDILIDWLKDLLGLP